MSSKGEYTLTVPADLVKKTKGLAIDIGGSLAKFVYRSKDNLKEAESKTDRGHLQFVSFPRSELSEALAYIRQHADITRNGINERPEILSTGYGCMEFGKTISETLNLRLKTITEFECQAKALTHLASELPRKDLLEPHDEEAAKLREDQMRVTLAAIGQFLEETKLDSGLTVIDSQTPINDRMQSVEPLDKCEHIYPCLLVIIGTGMVYLQVDEDKSFKVLELCQRGGATFHGVGALLTGVKEFHELLELASRGNEKNVGLYSDDLLPKGATDESTIYAKCAGLMEPELVYSFGKATRTAKANFHPEDLAISWLNDCARDISESLVLWCQVTGIRRMFICGGFCNNLLVRDCITKELGSRIFLLHVRKPHKDGRIQFDFLKPELPLEAIGALIFEYEKLTQENSKANA